MDSIGISFFSRLYLKRGKSFPLSKEICYFWGLLEKIIEGEGDGEGGSSTFFGGEIKTRVG
jgi:hypothetical protein